MDKAEFRELLAEKVVILDGAMGTELQKRGSLDDIEAPEELNLKYPGRLQAVYRDYLEAGAEVILTNTFGANRLKLKEYGLDGRIHEINQAGIRIAREVADKYRALVAADIGPLGSYLAPLGAVSFDDAYALFSGQVQALAAAGPDLVVIETMAEIREVKAALLAAKDHFSGPVLVQMTFTADGTTVTGTDYKTFLSVAESMGADGVGMNCSVGPEELARLAAEILPLTRLPVSFKPNAGMPKLVNRTTIFPGTAEEFVAASLKAYRAGANLLGGCCGTTPEFIRALARELKGKKPAARAASSPFFLSSRNRALDLNDTRRRFGDKVFVIGERINPTNRRKFQDELLAGNFSLLRSEARDQAASGAHILDLNLGLPNADEKALMVRAVEEVQETVAVPLCLDSSSAGVLEAGIKACAGKPLINSVNGDKEKLERVLPLVKRYGAAVIGLAMDETGIPKTAARRLEIAGRILAAASDAGIPAHEVVIDYLTLAVSAMPEQIPETLQAIRESKKRWPNVKTVLGVSNVSFGLPARQVLNSTFLTLAVEAGLDIAILNPHENWKIDDPSARDLLLGKDPNGERYIRCHGQRPAAKPASAAGTQRPARDRLYAAVVEGGKEEIRKLVEEVLASGAAPLAVANDILLAALNEVGMKFGAKEYFLPQVIRSAEAAQAAFTVIKPLLRKEKGGTAAKIVLATVKGDVHDIGKNIVAAVLESHGWDVVDLGKNISAAEIVAAARREGAALIGLSALMTTTMPEMENVVRERDRTGIAAKIIVGGAPVTERFAREIGADGYAKDAVEAARTAQSLLR